MGSRYPPTQAFVVMRPDQGIYSAFEYLIHKKKLTPGEKVKNNLCLMYNVLFNV